RARGSNIRAVRTQSWFAARSCIRSSMVAPDSSGTPDKTVRVGFPAVCDSMVRKRRVPGDRRAGRSNGRVAGSHDPAGAASRAALAGASAVICSALSSSGQPKPRVGQAFRGRLRLLQSPDELILPQRGTADTESLGQVNLLDALPRP